MNKPPEKRPLILGLTGSIAMGKSTVAGMFEALGVPVFDADHEVRMLQGPGGALLPQIEAAFPGSTGPEGVNRDKLGALVFGDRDELAKLEVIVHPAVAQSRETFLYRHANSPLVVFDIPLLFEKGGEKDVDKIVVVSAPPEVQRARVLRREGMTEEKFAQILALQLPDAAKRARADFVIDTSGVIEQTQKAVEELVEQLSSGLHD
ncbi:dephospho-CoA kinase [Aurantiacibacter marinus]|uniref:Dephospho-CoA kinase n=1 Tax=Aurantiacibacter marinus TaxID=874156 RepID=A0A0H0XS03_9SPHN|nr:dephospho-CoA kinase [Aurantiacibacter marinus]KLI64737.1 dephospho-CoA kinase [Aurantiacibacter marinus]